MLTGAIPLLASFIIMVRNIISLFVLSVSLLALIGCGDDSPVSDPVVPTPVPTPEPEPEPVPEDDYTVIFWGIAGNNERLMVPDLYDLLKMRESGEIGENVNFVGMLKPSQPYMKHLADDNMDGTIFFDLGEKSGVTLKDYDAITEEIAYADYVWQEKDNQCLEMYKTFFFQTKARKVDDTSYTMYSADKLSAFIKEAAALHPAKHYVLMMLGHGSGYNPVEETAGAGTRAAVLDPYLDFKGLTAEAVVDAVSKSGIKIQTLFLQNCLMATLENLAAYQDCADFAMASAEVTMSGYLQHFVKGLTTVGDDEQKLKSMAGEVIDQYVASNQSVNSQNTSLGFYDLRKMSDLLGVVKDITDFYCKWYEQEPQIVEVVLLVCCCSYDYRNYGNAVLQSRDRAFSALKLIQSVDFATLPEQDQINAFKGFINDLMVLKDAHLSNGFILSSLLLFTYISKINTPMGEECLHLYNDYRNQLQEMAYININYDMGEESEMGKSAYAFASPSVNIFSMNESGYKPMGFLSLTDDQIAEMEQAATESVHNGDTSMMVNMILQLLLGGNFFASYADLATIKSNYTSSRFDKATHWSKLLEKINNNPNLLTNQTRMDFYRIWKLQSQQ